MFIENRNSYIKPILSLCGAGAAMTLTNPIELVRIRMQTMSELVQLGKLNKCYSGVIDCVKRVQCQEGLYAFWKGNGAKLIRFYSSQTINFCSKQFIRTQVRRGNFGKKGNSFALNTLSGMLGSWISLSVLYPIEHARNCLSNSIGSTKKTILSSMASTVKHGGIRALYLGSSVSMVGVAIFRGTNFGIFDTFKLKKQGIQRWALAYLSSFLAIIFTYPSDTVRRRMICAQTKECKYKGFFDCLRKMYKNQGLGSFYRGGPVIFLQSLSSSCVLYTYDKISSEMRKNRQ